MTPGIDRPLPPDVVLRPWRDDADLTAMATARNATNEADERDDVMAPELIAGNYAMIEGFDPRTEVLIAEVGGEVVGWAVGAGGREEDSDKRILMVQCCVVPEHRGHGIGSALLRWGEAAAAAHADRMHPSDGRRRVYETWLRDGERAARGLLERRGYVPARWGHEMSRDLSLPIPDAPLPAGIEIRPTTPATAMQVLRAFDEAARDTWEYGGLAEAELAGLLQVPYWGQLDRWVVAWEGDEVVAGVLGWIDDDENRAKGRLRGYVEHIFTRRPWRGRGIAGALIAQAMRNYRAEGMTEGELSVDADNPSGAGSLYERMGFRRHGGITMLRRPAG